MFAHQQMIESMWNGSLEVDCSTIRIYPAVEDAESREYSGPGIIRAAGNSEEFQVKVFLMEKYIDWFELSLSGSAMGKLYNLDARDVDGNRWMATGLRVFPRSETTVSTSMYQVTIVSEDSLYDCGEEYEVKLLLGYVDAFQPNKKGIDIWREYAKEFYFIETPAIININGCEVQIMQDKQKCLSMHVSSTLPITESFVDHLVQSAQFVYGHALSRFAYSSNDPRAKTWSSVLQRYESVPWKTRPIFPPLDLRLGGEPEDFWRMFTAFLQYLCDQPTKGEAVRQNVWSVIRSWDASADAMGLTISVAIEGVLKHCFAEHGMIQDEFANDIAQFILCVESLPISKRSKGRIKGVLPKPNKFNAREALGRLAEIDLFPENLVHEWVAVRNSRAHADTLGDTNIRSTYSRNYRILQLFYYLVFAEIRYTGNYTDYSERGYREKVFDKTLSHG